MGSVMERSRTIAFSVLASLCLLAVLCNLVIGLASGQAGTERTSELEGRSYTAFPKTTPSSIAKGEFQSSFESWTADMVPARDAVVLGNAQMQRQCIQLAATTFGFEVFPTYFGSEYCTVPEDGMVIARAQRVPERNEQKKHKAWVSTINQVVSDNPDVNFVYDCVTRQDQTYANPTYNLRSGELVNPDWAQDYLLSKLDDRVMSFVDDAGSYERIKEDWLLTEEHWKPRRAYESYNKIADLLSLKKCPTDDLETVAKDWYGDYARMGLDLDYTIDLEDVPTNYSSLKFYALGDFGGKEIGMGVREDVLAGKKQFKPHEYHCYSRYFGRNSCEAANDSSGNDKTALVVCDSLSYALKRVLASNYAHTVFLLPGNEDLEGSFQSYIDKYNPQDVIIILHATKYRSIEGHSPQFVGRSKGSSADE